MKIWHKIQQLLGNKVTPSPTVGTHNEATRLQWIQAKLAALPAGWRLLDAGAGEQPFKRHCQHLHYVSQDFNEYEPTAVKVGLQMPTWTPSQYDIISDITQIPEPEAAFDAILCSEVLEHIPNPVLAIREFARLLRPSGRLILTAPFCSITHFAPFHFSTGFNTFFYRHHLAECGFEILEMQANGNFFEYLAQEVSRLDFCAAQYASQALSYKEQDLKRAMLELLQRLSAADTQSQELLCFGYMLVAEKKSVDS